MVITALRFSSNSMCLLTCNFHYKWTILCKFII
nr:MAG TPA: hypothetical protein [Caudoviricetes sp.]